MASGRIIEELNLSESAARLFGSMTEGECAAVSTRKDAVQVSSDHSMNSTAGYLLNLLAWTEQVEIQIVVIFIDH